MEKDRCVLCGKETKFDKDLHIDLRTDYIGGIGQLCRTCAKKLKDSNKVK